MTYRLEDLTKDMRKALALPPGEAMRRLSGRAVRYARAVRNRRRVPQLSDDELLASLLSPARSLEELVRRRGESEPLLAASSRSAVIAGILRERAPQTLEPILISAEAIAEGVYDLLGSGPVPLGRIPDWHADFKSGRRWDRGAHASEIPVVHDRGWDIKVPWELSRLQHLPTLGMATAFTGDPRFREHGVAHLSSFLAENPVYRGVNWRCTMDVALRASEILASEGYLRGAGDARFWGELLKSLLLHSRFILENLEEAPVRGNHYLADLAGLYLCGLGLREFQEARGWQAFARERLLEEMGRQVGRDGLDFEASLSYHAFVTEMFLFPALLSEGREAPFPDSYMTSLEKMVEGAALMIRPDGTLPQVGDNDDGRFLILSQYHRPRRDWRPLLALGSYLFRRGEWLQLSGDAWVEGAWALGEPFLQWRDSLEPSADPREFRCTAFPEAGIYQLGAGPIQMVVDAGGVGQGGNGGHAHNDTLAFDLFAFGREVLPDRGTGVYTPDLALRNSFRSTRSHNTLQVDGEEINPLSAEPFRLLPADAPRAIRWRCGERYAYLQAEHTGYARLRDGVVHRRSILLDRTRGVFRIEDRLNGRGRHRIQASFHLAPGWGVLPGERGWTARDEEGSCSVTFVGSEIPGGASLKVEGDFHSPSYGVTRPARVARLEWEGELPCRLRYLLKVQEEKGP